MGLPRRKWQWQAMSWENNFTSWYGTCRMEAAGNEMGKYFYLSTWALQDWTTKMVHFLSFSMVLKLWNWMVLMLLKPFSNVFWLKSSNPLAFYLTIYFRKIPTYYLSCSNHSHRIYTKINPVWPTHFSFFRRGLVFTPLWSPPVLGGGRARTTQRGTGVNTKPQWQNEKWSVCAG